MDRIEGRMIEAYQKKGALWLYKKGGRHAILRSKLHSDGFFYSQLVIEDEDLLREAAGTLVDRLAAYTDFLYLVTGVVGPQTGATKLAEYVARDLQLRRGYPCFWASPKKSEDGESMFFEEGKSKPQNGDIILLVEDVLTTGGSVGRATQAVVGCGATALDKVLVIVNRSGAEGVGGVEIISLISCYFNTYKATECPLCAAGSEAVENPKDNWDRLTGVV